MKPEDKQKWIDAKVNNIKTTLDVTNSTKISTCDHYNWDAIEHLLMPIVAQKLKDAGYQVQIKVLWGVTDYLIA